MRRFALLSLLAATGLVGCDLFGDSTEKLAAAKEAEGRAIGGACRHAGRAIEDCYTLNKKADKAAVFNGWRDMNDYMRENKIDAVAPQGGVVADATEKAEKQEGVDKAASAARKASEPAHDDATTKKPAKSKKRDT